MPISFFYIFDLFFFYFFFFIYKLRSVAYPELGITSARDVFDRRPPPFPRQNGDDVFSYESQYRDRTIHGGIVF